MLVLLRISRPIKSDRMNLLFYGNVNMLFIKFSSPASSLASMCASMWRHLMSIANFRDISFPFHRACFFALFGYGWELEKAFKNLQGT